MKRDVFLYDKLVMTVPSVELATEDDRICSVTAAGVDDDCDEVLDPGSNHVNTSLGGGRDRDGKKLGRIGI